MAKRPAAPLNWTAHDSPTELSMVRASAPADRRDIASPTPGTAHQGVTDVRAEPDPPLRGSGAGEPVTVNEADRVDGPDLHAFEVAGSGFEMSAWRERGAGEEAPALPALLEPIARIVPCSSTAQTPHPCGSRVTAVRAAPGENVAPARVYQPCQVPSNPAAAHTAVLVDSPDLLPYRVTGSPPRLVRRRGMTRRAARTSRAMGRGALWS